MKPSELKFLIRECLAEVIQETVTETHGVVRACAYCDMIAPPLNNDNRSHGYCREHMIAFYMDQLQKTHSQAREIIDAKEKAGMQYPPNSSGAKETDPLPTDRASVAQR
jgi:hypothetical protein